MLLVAAAICVFRSAINGASCAWFDAVSFDCAFDESDVSYGTTEAAIRSASPAMRDAGSTSR